MDRRTFVVSTINLSLAGAVAGCIGEQEGDTDGEPSAEGDHREVRVEAENLTRELDNRIVEDGAVSVIIELKNIGTEPEYVDVRLQMRDRSGEDLGSQYSQYHGPIEPEGLAEIRFDVDENEGDIGGYELVVLSAEPPDTNEDEENKSAENDA